MKEYAPGIVNKENYGDPTRSLEAGQLADYVLQHHTTHRHPNTPHLDLRIGTPATGMHSWAIPKAKLPTADEKNLAIQTQIHSPGYNTFQGSIRSGYGEGFVRRQDLGKALLTKVTPNSVSFTISHTKVPVRYSLIRMGTRDGRNGRDWLLVHKAIPKTVEGVGDKPKYKLIEAVDLDDALEQATEVQEKIDGAGGVYEIGSKGETEAYSVNPRKTGEPIVHTERTGLTGVKSPEALSGTTLRGEIYATDPKGKAIPFQELSGILNSTIAKAVETRRVKKLKMQHAIFDIIKHKGKDVSQLPFEERKSLLKEVVPQLPSEHFHSPLSATEEEDKTRMLEDIRTGKNPRTSEGIIMHLPGNKVWKYKFRPESRGYVTGVFPGKAGRTGLPGGVTFSETPGGEELGHLGSGFTVDELKDIAKNLEAYKTKPMRITHMGKFPAGTLRAPVFSGWETDVKESTDMRMKISPLVRAFVKQALTATTSGQTADATTAPQAGYAMKPYGDQGYDASLTPQRDLARTGSPGAQIQPGPEIQPFYNPAARPGVPAGVVARPGTGTLTASESGQAGQVKKFLTPKGGPIATATGT
jgi:ATP-dependent DNA ligase